MLSSLVTVVMTSRAFFRLEFSVFEYSFSKNFNHTTNSDRLRSKLCQMLAASFIGFSKAQWEAARVGDKREAREGDDGNERRARAGSDPRFP